MKLNLPNIEKVVLLGGGRLLVSLVSWCKSEGVPVFVITSPRHASELIDDSQTLTDLLDKSSLPYLVTTDISSQESSGFLSDLSSAFCLSLGAAWIFKQDLIDRVFKGRLFNLHGTRLPQNRGGGGFSWQIMMGNRLGFCQLHLVDAGVDTGDIVRTKEFLYPPAFRTPKDYEEVYFNQNINFVLDFIKEIRQQGICVETIKQTEYFSTYWPRLNTKISAWIDWTEDIISLERYICAFDEPYEGAKTFLNGKKVFIKNVMVDFSDPQFHTFQSGIIYRKGPSWILVCAKGGSLIVNRICDEDGKDLSKTIKVGDRLSTPSSYLESRYERIVYTPSGIK